MIKMLRGIPVLKPHVNLHLHEFDTLQDINEFKSLYKRSTDDAVRFLGLPKIYMILTH